MPCAEWKHRRQIVLKITFCLIASLAGRCLRQILPVRLQEELSSENMIARLRRLAGAVHADAAFELFTHLIFASSGEMLQSADSSGAPVYTGRSDEAPIVQAQGPPLTE